MRPTTLSVLFAAGLLAALLPVPGLTSPRQGPAHASAPRGTPAWRASAALLPAGAPAPGGRQTLLLPSSVMPHQNARCSVEEGGGASSCSIFPGAPPPRRCSAHADAAQRCSAFQAAGTSAVECSTFGQKKSFCSVLQSGGGSIASWCSAEAGDFGGLQCSVLAAASKFQACSTESPAQSGNFCSAESPGLPLGVPTCSILGGGAAVRDFCSTGRPAPAGSCSATTDPVGFGTAVCSVLTGQRGVCSHLKGAPAGSCSTQTGAGAACSTINGPGGNHCTWP